MLEYSVVLGNEIRNLWAGNLLPFIDMLLNAPYFWPAVAAAAVFIVLMARLFIR